jgi:hypothetical protein
VYRFDSYLFCLLIYLKHNGDALPKNCHIPFIYDGFSLYLPMRNMVSSPGDVQPAFPTVYNALCSHAATEV